MECTDDVRIKKEMSAKLSLSEKTTFEIVLKKKWPPYQAETPMMSNQKGNGSKIISVRKNLIKLSFNV